MKKILITLRHPGPADAICSILPELMKRYIVIFVLTDSAINFIKDKYKKYFDKIQVYIPSTKLENGFVKYENNIKSCCCEFDGVDTKKLHILYTNLKELVNRLNPDIALRTTPALKWGVDELLPRVMKELGKYDRLRCYQEYYGSGRALNDRENEIACVGCKSFATVDEIAKNIKDYAKKSVTVVGWMNQGQFSKYKNYNDARNLFRIKNNIVNDFCILYCTIATEQLEKELKHYIFFLETIKKSNKTKKIFCKFHPRNSSKEIKEYIKITKEIGIPVHFLFKERYDEILSFSDVLVSATSAVNIDCIEYQVLRSNRLETICIYTKGELTTSFFKKAIEKEILPTHKEGSGILIVSEQTYNNVFDKIQNNTEYYSYLYEEAKKLYKNDYNKVKDNFINYLENKI